MIHSSLDQRLQVHLQNGRGVQQVEVLEHLRVQHTERAETQGLRVLLLERQVRATAGEVCTLLRGRDRVVLLRAGGHLQRGRNAHQLHDAVDEAVDNLETIGGTGVGGTDATHVLGANVRVVVDHHDVRDFRTASGPP